MPEHTGSDETFRFSSDRIAFVGKRGHGGGSLSLKVFDFPGGHEHALLGEGYVGVGNEAKGWCG